MKSHKTSALKKVPALDQKNPAGYGNLFNKQGQAWNLNVFQSKSSKRAGRKTYLVIRCTIYCDIKKVW